MFVSCDTYRPTEVELLQQEVNRLKAELDDAKQEIKLWKGRYENIRKRRPVGILFFKKLDKTESPHSTGPEK